jgi:uracil DNA glycosylase
MSRARNERIVGKYQNVFKKFPIEWNSFLTGIVEPEIEKMECIISNNKSVLDFIPKQCDWWAPFRDINPQDVKVILIGDSLDTKRDINRLPMTDGIFCGRRSGIGANLETNLLFQSIKQDLKNGLIGCNGKQDIYESMYNDRLKENNWSLECWKLQGILMINTFMTFDDFHLSENSLKFNTIVQKILNNLISKYKNNPMVIVYFGTTGKSLIDISKATLKKATKLKVFETVSLRDACKVNESMDIFLKSEIFYKINKQFRDVWDDYEILFV